MPYKSEKQARLMRAVAHSPEFAEKVGISQSVGRKFEEHKATGGTVKESEMKRVFAGKETPAEERKEKVAAKKAGMTYKAAERKFEGEKYCGGGKTKGYAKGGMTAAKREMGNKSARNPALNERPYMQPDERENAQATGPDGGDLTTYSYKPREGRNVYVGSNASAAGAGRGKTNRGIEPTIPAEIREVLMERQRQKDMAEGEAASRYKTGGSVRGAGIAKRGFGCMGKK